MPPASKPPAAKPPAPKSARRPAHAPPPSRRLLLLGLSAVLSAVCIVATTIHEGASSSSAALGDNLLANFMDLARYKGLRSSVVLQGTKGIKGEVATRQSLLTSYVEALDVATDFARRSGVVAPSDTLLLSLTAAVQAELSPEGAQTLLKAYTSSVRLARLQKYMDLVASGTPPSSAVAKAALIQ